MRFLKAGKFSHKPFVILVLIIANIFLFWAYQSTEDHLMPKVGLRLTSIINERKGEIQDYLQSQRQNLHSIANDHDSLNNISLYLQREKSSDDLKSALSSIPQNSFENLFIFSPKGKLQFAQKNDFQIETLRASALYTCVNQSIATLSATVSLFAYDSLTKEETLYITFPLIDNGKFLGVIGAKINYHPFYKIIQNYNGLGKKGNLFLVQKKDKLSAQIISPLRNEVNAAFMGDFKYPKIPLMIKNSINAESGYGVQQNYQEIKSIGAWSYISELNWGIVASIPYKEVNGVTILLRRLFLASLIITVCVAAFFIFYSGEFSNFVSHQFSFRKMRALRWILIPLCCLSVLFFFWTVFKHNHKIDELFQQQQATVKKHSNHLTQEIHFQLNRVQSLSQSLAYDLTHGIIETPQIKESIYKIMESHETLSTIVVYFSPTGHLSDESIYAIEVDHPLGRKIISSSFSSKDRIKAASWYLESMQHDEGWLPLYNDPVINQDVVSYSTPFYHPLDVAHKEPVGYVISSTSMKQIGVIASSLPTSQVEYSMIADKSGRLLYLSSNKYFHNRATLSDLSQSMDSAQFQLISEKMKEGKQGWSKFYDNNSNSTQWIYYMPISGMDWEIGVVLESGKSFLQVNLLYHHYFLIVLSTTILLITLILTLCSIGNFTWKRFKFFSIASSFIFLFGSLSFWAISKNSSFIQSHSNEFVVTNQSDLNHFLLEKDRIAIHSGKKSPSHLPTGFYIYSLEFSANDEVTFSGYIWQRYNKTLHKDVEKGVVFPEATSIVRLVEAYREEEGDNVTIGWDAIIKQPQQFQYQKYPIDRNNISISMIHKNMDENVILIPDLGGYEHIEPQAKPGLRTNYQISGYSILGTFYSLIDQKLSTNFGLDSGHDMTNRNMLTWNIEVSRNISGAFIRYFLPLFVIICILFGMLAVIVNWTKSEADLIDSDISYKAISVYTALIFALIIIHSRLRAHHDSGDIFYIEFFFFINYVTLILLVLHSWLLHLYPKLGSFPRRMTPAMLITFWPLQLAAWFGMTFLVFYFS